MGGNGRLELIGRDRQADIPRPHRSEERFTQTGADRPEAFERVDVGLRNTAAQMPVDVLRIFALEAVDVARQVEVIAVALDLFEANHAREAVTSSRR